MTVASLPALPAFRSRVVPVVVIDDARTAVPLAQALLDGGIDVMEITLRSDAALAAIEAVARAVPAMHLGAGTVTRAADVPRVVDAGARFALSPGCTDALVDAVRAVGLPFIPGVMTPGEVMRAREHGFLLQKLFPAVQAGGVPLLPGCAAVFECANRSQYDEGDHVIFVGEVERCEHRAGAQPLIFHGGRYFTELPL